MLFYLDNWQSQAPRDDIASGPNARRPGLNENYGRELLELHTVGVHGGYTQEDVIAVARAFTGWTIYDVQKLAEFQFNPAGHDRKAKIVLGHSIPAMGGEQDGIQVIDILARHRATAAFISRELARRFVSDDPPASLVDRMAATFLKTDGDLRAVLQTLFASPEFWAENVWQVKLKSPLEMVVSAARAMNAEVTDPAALAQRIADLGEPLYGKLEPTGYPNTGEAWTNTASVLGRINVAAALSTNQIPGVTIDAGRFHRKPARDVARELQSRTPAASTLAALERGAHAQAATPAMLATLVLGSPDFQRRVSMFTRRLFLRASAVAMAGVGVAPQWLVRAAAVGATRPKFLVAVFQRGAADGLNIVVPFLEKREHELRPRRLLLPEPGQNNGAIDLDGRFGLHPSLEPLKPFWDSGQLAIVEATGSPDPTRSHFDAQDFMECGTPGRMSEDGWLNRALPLPGASPSPLRAVSIGPQLARTLRGRAPAVAVNRLEQFQVRNQSAASILESMYATTADARLMASGKETFDAVKMIDAINRAPYVPAKGAQYAGEFGRSLQQIARLIKADVGVEAAFADIGGWDHHTNETPQLSNLLREFGTSLAAFARDMGDRMEDIVLVTMSEFGRTVREDGNSGTDHGHGSVMTVLGGPVRGGHIYGRWPGLEPEQLYEPRDLAVTTDFRDVLSELVSDHLGQNADRVFPGFKR